MNTEDIKKELQVVAEQTKTELDGKLKMFVAQKDFDDLAAKNAELEKALIVQGTKLKELEVGGYGAPMMRKSFESTLREEIEKKKADIFQLKEKQGSNITLTLKAPHTMHTTDIVPSVPGAAPYMITTLEPGYGRPPVRPVFLREIVDTRSISTMYIAYVDITNIQGGATPVAEGALKPQNSFDFQEGTKKVEKIAKYIKTSRENIADVTGIENEINYELRTSVELVLDQQIYAGTGVSPQILGITTVAQPFTVTGTPFAAAIPSANHADVLLTAAALIGANLFVANIALVNPQDLAFIQMSKTAYGSYIAPPFSDLGFTQIGTMRVIPTAVVPPDNFVVMDSTKYHLRIREEFNIDMGYEGQDFIMNLLTILGELRAGSYVRLNDTKAFVKGLFSTALAAITAP